VVDLEPLISARSASRGGALTALFVGFGLAGIFQAAARLSSLPASLASQLDVTCVTPIGRRLP
jgi:hypothetical protein